MSWRHCRELVLFVASGSRYVLLAVLSEYGVVWYGPCSNPHMLEMISRRPGGLGRHDELLRPSVADSNAQSRQAVTHPS